MMTSRGAREAGGERRDARDERRETRGERREARRKKSCTLLQKLLSLAKVAKKVAVISKMCASRNRTRVCALRVRRFVHWATAARPIDFMLCSVFMSSWQRIIDSAFCIHYSWQENCTNWQFFSHYENASRIQIKILKGIYVILVSCKERVTLKTRVYHHFIQRQLGMWVLNKNTLCKNYK